MSQKNRIRHHLERGLPQLHPTHYESARMALTLARTTDDVKGWINRAAAMKEYARKAKDRQLEIDAAEIRIRAERRLGEMLREQKETVGMRAGARDISERDGLRGSATELRKEVPTLAEVGIDKKLSSHAQKVAAVAEDEFEQSIEFWRHEMQEASARVATSALLASVMARSKNHRTQGTGNNEWYTPAEYIELARDSMGSIDTDPASSEVANQQVGASLFYTTENSGINNLWRGNVWMNPPYATPIIGEFAQSVVSKFLSGEIEQACVLVNNCTETNWFQTMAKASSAFCFLSSRINFLNTDGETAHSPLQGQCLIYFGKNIERFASVFSKKGMVLRHV